MLYASGNQTPGTLPTNWPIAGALESLVLKPMREDRETLELLKRDDFDAAIRERLARGRAACDTRTKALWYCYSYLLMHLDAYHALIRHHWQFFDELLLDSGPERLVFDFGCGPMTSCLAMAEANIQCPCGVVLTYVGIDHMEPMVQMARGFAQHAFSPYWEPILYQTWEGIELPATPWRDHPDLAHGPWPQYLVFSFSYFFGQHLTREQISSLAAFVRCALTDYRVDNAYLIYLNKDATGYHDNYSAFKRALGLPVEPIAPIHYHYRRFRRLAFAGFSRPEASLYQEIIKLDWRRHVQP